MAITTVLSKAELKDLKEKYAKLTAILETDKNEFLLFKFSPIKYLKTTEIDVMKYIDNKYSPGISHSFSTNSRRLVHFADTFNKCAWCRTLTVIIISSALGKANIATNEINTVMSDILRTINDVFKPNNSFHKRMTVYLKENDKRYSPDSLSRVICDHLGYGL